MNDGILHDKDDPKSIFPPPGKLMSMLDILGGGNCTCDQCGRWQSVSGFGEHSMREQLSLSGWTFAGEDLCPLCAKGKQTVVAEPVRKKL